jgi:hypothetical protein
MVLSISGCGRYLPRGTDMDRRGIRSFSTMT